MSLYIASINSGSNGNCYYVGNEQEAVLVDVGIACREIEKRMDRLELSMNRVKAIFISHEHIDHIRGVEKLAKKYNLPVYITKDTMNGAPFEWKRVLTIPLEANKSIAVGNLKVTPFVKHHDAADPVSFIIENNGIKAGVITDIGIACEQVIHYFRQCHACFLESNYDERMLEEGGYPQRLKNRIRGGKGHISNAQALHLFLKHRPAFMSHLLLAHLSRNNNKPEIVQELFTGHADNTSIIVASRYEESDVYHIYNEEHSRQVIPFMPVQLTLFE